MDTDGRTMTDEDFDLAVGHVTSFYQSKRAILKKQLTHWIGKFMIVKAENNRIRQLLKAKDNYSKIMEERVKYLERDSPTWLDMSRLKDEVISLKKSLASKPLVVTDKREVTLVGMVKAEC
jgi:hypothetical protein